MLILELQKEIGYDNLKLKKALFLQKREKLRVWVA